MVSREFPVLSAGGEDVVYESPRDGEVRAIVRFGR